MHVRLARLSDVSSIYRIGRNDFTDENWFTKGVLEWTIKSNPGLCWVLEEDRKILGARLVCECYGKSVWGWLMLINKDKRHEHLGTFLFDETCKLLKKKGFGRIVTDVYTKNTASVNWHRKMGYRKLGLVKDWFDNGKDAMIFCKDL